MDWGAYGSKVPYNVRQLPSEANALGELKILFPNKHAIYMHDTPQKSFFERDMRALSHGCVRVEQARALAAWVLGVSQEEITAMIAQGTHSVPLPQEIPVSLVYHTRFPGDHDEVASYPDLYAKAVSERR